MVSPDCKSSKYRIWFDPGRHRRINVQQLANLITSSFSLQFLITMGENLDYLDGVHTVFGEVTEGADVLAKINETFVDKDFVPFQDIR